MIKISGIYKITNTITGDFYIGSSRNIKLRYANHKSPSNWKKYPNIKLYKAMQKYGMDNFIIDIIEETFNLKEREQYYIDQLKPIYNNYRANGLDIERYKESCKRSSKAWYESHKDDNRYKRSAYYKEWYGLHQEERLGGTCTSTGKGFIVQLVTHHLRIALHADDNLCLVGQHRAIQILHHTADGIDQCRVVVSRSRCRQFGVVGAISVDVGDNLLIGAVHQSRNNTNVSRNGLRTRHKQDVTGIE